MGTSGAFIAVCVAGDRPGRAGDARHPGRHFLALPVRVFHVAVAVQAHPDPGRGRHGHHAGGGHGDADHLQHADASAGWRPCFGRYRSAPSRPCS